MVPLLLCPHLHTQLTLSQYMNINMANELFPSSILSAFSLSLAFFHINLNPKVVFELHSTFVIDT